jgi:hypothetical protein
MPVGFIKRWTSGENPPMAAPTLKDVSRKLDSVLGKLAEVRKQIAELPATTAADQALIDDMNSKLDAALNE